jgi:hypothetical protein
MKVGKRTPEDRQIAVAVGAVTSKDDTFSVILGSPYGSILARDGGPERDPPYFVSLERC